MKWEKQATKNCTTYSSTVDEKDWNGMTAELPAFWLKLLESVEAAYKPGEWNRLYLEFWPDSGRIIAYPHKRGTIRSKWRVGVQIYMPFVEEQFEKLPDPDEEPDRFESGSVAIHGHLSECVRKALKNKEANQALRHLKETNDFTIWIQEADDEEASYQLPLIY